jgi:hypothetical protein
MQRQERAMKIFQRRRQAGEQQPDNGRRGLLRGAVAATGGSLLALGGNREARAQGSALKFPGEEPDVKILYQFNKADADYQGHIMHSASVVLRHYGDNVGIVIECFGPGIHILLKKPQREVDPDVRERVGSLMDYGVAFHACGETLKALDLGKDALIDGAKYVDSGVVDMVDLQREDGYTYVAW